MPQPTSITDDDIDDVLLGDTVTDEKPPPKATKPSAEAVSKASFFERAKTTVVAVGLTTSRSVRRGLAYGNRAMTRSVALALLFAIPYAMFTLLTWGVTGAFALTPILGWVVVFGLVYSAVSTLYGVNKTRKKFQPAFSMVVA